MLWTNKNPPRRGEKWPMRVHYRIVTSNQVATFHYADFFYPVTNIKVSTFKLVKPVIDNLEILKSLFIIQIYDLIRQTQKIFNNKQEKGTTFP